MDTESNYELAFTPTESLTPRALFSIEFLIERGDEFEKRDQLEMLDKLTVENSALQRQILHYQEQWCSTLAMLRNAHEALLILQNALKKCFEGQIEAERSWLAFWRINSEASHHSSYSPNGWI
jgi:hypothetical protein